MSLRMVTILGLVMITSSAFAGSDTVTCATSSKSISFSVGNGDHVISINAKDKKTGKASVYQAPVKLMPSYAYNVDANAEKIVAVLPVGSAKTIKADNSIQVVYDKNGKLKCTGREITDETYKQTMLLTQRLFNEENQGFHYMIFEGKSVPGLDASTGFITAAFTCRHQQVTTAGGCFADEGDTVELEPRK